MELDKGELWTFKLRSYSANVCLFTLNTLQIHSRYIKHLTTRLLEWLRVLNYQRNIPPIESHLVVYSICVFEFSFFYTFEEFCDAGKDHEEYRHTYLRVRMRVRNCSRCISEVNKFPYTCRLTAGYVCTKRTLEVILKSVSCDSVPDILACLHVSALTLHCPSVCTVDRDCISCS